MRNAFLTLLITVAVASFFSFTNGKKGRPITDDYDDDDQDGITIADTTPKKTGAHKSQTAVYDSFGHAGAPDSAAAPPSSKTKNTTNKTKTNTKTIPYDSFGKPKKMDSTHP